MMCAKVLPYEGLKIGTCDSSLCLFAQETLGIGTDVLSEITKNALVVELLIYFLSASAAIGEKRDTLEPMCPVDLDSILSRQKCARMTAAVDDAAPPVYRGQTSFFHPVTQKKNFQLIIETLNRIPKLSVVKERFTSNEQLRAALDARSLLAFPLLRWTLSSMRSDLRFIEKEHQVDGLGNLQFLLRSSRPEREAVFQANKRCQGGNSFFAWHGSAAGNWHCIVREGLKNYSGTNLMSTGQVYGPGIYFALNISGSLCYTGSPQPGWRNGDHIPPFGCTVVALCEIVDDPHVVTYHPNMIVTVQDESCVATRFLFVLPAGSLFQVTLLPPNSVIAAKLMQKFTSANEPEVNMAQTS
jgi:hypothetical protein